MSATERMYNLVKLRGSKEDLSIFLEIAPLYLFYVNNRCLSYEGVSPLPYTWENQGGKNGRRKRSFLGPNASNGASLTNDTLVPA